MKPKKTKSILACVVILCMVFGIQSNLAFVFAQENDDTIVQENITDYTTDETDTAGATMDDTKDTNTTGKDKVNTEAESEPVKMNNSITPASEKIPQSDGAVVDSETTITSDTTWSNETILTESLKVNPDVTLTLGANVTISGNITISGGGTIKRDTNYTGILLSVPAGSSLTLNNITVDGGAIFGTIYNPEYDVNEVSFATLGHSLYNIGTKNSDSIVYVENDGELVISSGTLLKNNDRTNGKMEASNPTAGAINNLGKVTMNGGMITRCRAGAGGAVFSRGTFIMTGGEICNNAGYRTVNSDYAGGGLRAIGPAYLSGGIIHHNVSSYGGGIYCENTLDIGGNFQLKNNYATAAGGGIGCSWGSNGPPSINMMGGEITNNQIGSETVSWGTREGAGITGAYYNFNMTGGIIKNNTIADDAKGDKRSIDILNASHTSNTHTFKISGNSIIGNGKSGGLGLWHEWTFKNTFSISGALDTDSNIYITENYYSGLKAGVIIIQATNEYKIVSSDIEKIHIGNENLFAYLDSANNVVKITDLRLNGGTVTDTSPLGKRQLPVPVKEGYIFNGWYNKEEFNGEIMNTVEEGQIYYAKWTEKTSTSVSFRENLNLNKIYDGNAMSLSENDYIVTEGAGKVTFTYQEKDGNKWKYITSAPINAGTYKVKAIVEENDTYKSTETDWKEFTISKAMPTYEVPTNLTAIVGQTLADVTLPESFAWQDDTTTSVGSAGTNTFKVTYTPKDTTNYNTVTDIEVILTVNPKMEELNAIPIINVSDKTLTVGDTFNPLEGVTASDKEDGDLTKVIEVLENNVDTSKASIYEITYKVTDSKGASSTKTITVTVKAKDTQKPTIDDNKKPSATDTDKKPASTDKQTTSNSPKTGDSTNMTTWLALMFVSLGLLAGVFTVRKSRKSR